MLTRLLHRNFPHGHTPWDRPNGIEDSLRTLEDFASGWVHSTGTVDPVAPLPDGAWFLRTDNGTAWKGGQNDTGTVENKQYSAQQMRGAMIPTADGSLAWVSDGATWVQWQRPASASAADIGAATVSAGFVAAAPFAEALTSPTPNVMQRAIGWVANKFSSRINPTLPPYNWVGDGSPADFALLAQANADCAGAGTDNSGRDLPGKTLHIPQGRWLIGSNTFNFLWGANYEFASPDTALVYTGNGVAVKADTVKRVNCNAFTIDLWGAGDTAIGLQLAGVWDSTFRSPKIIGKPSLPSNQVGIDLVTSGTFPNFGNYRVTIDQAQLLYGKLGIGIRSRRHASDNFRMTTIKILNTTIGGHNVGIELRDMDASEVEVYIENCLSSAGSIDHCSDLTFISQYPETNGTGVIYLPNCDVTEWIPATAQQSDVSQYLPRRLSGGMIRQKATAGEPTDYYYELASVYSYAESLVLAAKGGGFHEKVISYGAGQGGLKLLTRGPYADNAEAISAGLTSGVLYRTTTGELRVVV